MFVFYNDSNYVKCVLISPFHLQTSKVNLYQKHNLSQLEIRSMKYICDMSALLMFLLFLISFMNITARPLLHAEKQG